MASALRLENAIFVTQQSLLLIGWCLRDAGDELVLRINGKRYAAIAPNMPRPEVAEHFGRAADEPLGIRRTVLLDAELPAGDGLEVELALLRGDNEIASDKALLDTVEAEHIHRLLGDFDESSERLESRYCWADNLIPGLTTVILGVYNGKRYLAQAIDSILAQSDRNLQLIAVDDGSTDGTREILLDFKARDPRVELVLKERNAGQAQAFNSGILRARGDLTCIMDADDFWFANKVETVRKAFEADKKSGRYAMFQHRLDICYGDRLSQEPFRSALLEGDVLNHCRKEQHWLPGPFIPTAGLAFPTEILRAVFPIPRSFRICADGFLTRAAISLGHSKAISEPLGAYRIHGKNSTVGNQAFDQEGYIQRTLLPAANRFYQKHDIEVPLPIQNRADSSIALNRVVRRRSGKGMFYAAERKPIARGIEDFRDIHKGKRAFIVATGPSLQMSDLDFLKDEITFACNKIPLAFGETDWRPTYYSIIDSLVSETLQVDWAQLPGTNFFPEDLKGKYGCLANTFFVKNRTPIYDGEQRVFEFSRDLTTGAAGGFTVVYFMMQLAFHMGIDELYLIGLDFNFSYKSVSGEKTAKNEDVIVNDDEVNHFHRDYRPKGEKWTIPRLDLQEAAFRKAKEAFEQAGRKIYNASRSTKLDLFERVDFDALMRAEAEPGKTGMQVRDVYGDVMSSEYSSTFGELRVSGWVAPKPERIDVFHEGQLICSAQPRLEGHVNASLVSGSGIYVWRAAGVAPIKTGDPVRVVMRFADGSSSVVVRPVETRPEEEDMKLALKELVTRNRLLQNRIDALSRPEPEEGLPPRGA